jgi:ubiquinone/menaquinone biosynthesis C-methylase UbiE
MKYIPELTDMEIKENHRHFEERASVYKRKGLDFMKSREFIIGKAGPLKGRILEIGAGNGHTTLALAKAGHKFTAIDNDRESLKVAAMNLAYGKVLDNVELYLMDGRSLTFADDSFDNVVIVNLFHHVSDVERLLSEADRVLHESGKLVLADFNKDGMEIISSVHAQEGRTHESSGVSRDQVYSYLNAADYEIEKYNEKYHWILIAEKMERSTKTCDD